jgi:hypothetical protein
MGASAPAGLCCKEGVIRRLHAETGAFPPAAGTGLWSALAFQCSNSSDPPTVEPPVFPLLSLAGANAYGFRLLKTAGGFDFAEFAPRANSWASWAGVWGFTPNSENQNAERFGSPCAGRSAAGAFTSPVIQPAGSGETPSPSKTPDSRLPRSISTAPGFPHLLSLREPKPPGGRKPSWAQRIGGARSGRGALRRGRSDSGAPDSLVFCGETAKNAQRMTEKSKRLRPVCRPRSAAVALLSVRAGSC